MSNPNHDKAQAQELDQHSREGMQHLVYAHYMHTATEVVHFSHHGSDALEHAFAVIASYNTAYRTMAAAQNMIAAARKVVLTQAQLAYDLARIKRAIVTVGIEVAQGKRAPEVLVRLNRAYDAAMRAFEAERPLLMTAREFLRESRLANLAKSAANAHKIGFTLARFEAALAASKIGSGLLLPAGRLFASKSMQRGLVIAGAILGAAQSYSESRAQTQIGKITNGVLGGGAAALPFAHPGVAIAELAAPKGYKPSEVFRATADVATAGVESLLVHDTRPLDDFHKQSMAGAHGKVLQIASDAGEYWSKKGFEGTMREFGDALRWWVAL